MNKILQRIIANRKKWLIKESIQDWNATDTAFVAEKYAAEKDLIIKGIEESTENWKAEYDNCRALLNELVALKELKDKEGKTDDYLFRQPIAWEQAKVFLKDYQHLKW